MRLGSAYRKLGSISLQEVIAYRSNFFLGLLGPMFFLLSMLYLWHTLLAHGSANGFDWEHMKGYLVVAFVCGNLVSMWSDFSIANNIREGAIALDLTKPIDYQTARLAEAGGVALFELASAILAGTVVLAAFGGTPVPSFENCVFFAISMALVMPLKFCLSYVAGLACFWTQNYFGIFLTRTAITNLFSG